MNALINSILQAQDHPIDKFLQEPGLEKRLLERWGKDDESALTLVFRLMNTSWEDKKNKAVWAKMAETLKQAFRQLPPEKIPLVEATISGCDDAVDNYLAREPLTQANRGEYERAASNAVLMGNCELTERLLDAGVSVETRHQDKTLLMIACETGSESLTDLLLARKADPNARMPAQPNMGGMTVLMIAAGQKNVKVLEKLIAAGADHRLIGPMNQTARDFATNKKSQAYLDQLARERNHATLHEAIAADSVGAVRQFLTTGAALNTVDEQGNTPIILALQIGNPLVVRLLVEAGATLNGPDIWKAAFQSHSKKNTVNITAELIALNADVNRRDSLGLPPLFLANEPEEMRLLLNAGADPHAVFVQPVDFQAIKFKAITLSTAKDEVKRKKTDDTIDSMVSEIEAGMAIMNRQMAVAEFFKDKDESFFENSQNRTDENATYFDLYPRAKAEATASARRYTVIDYHKVFANRKTCQFMRDYLGMAKDAYDIAMEEIKSFGKKNDPAFLAEADRIGSVLNCKAVPWKKRKGVLHFTAALHKTLPNYYNLKSECDDQNSNARVDGFEPALFAKLRSEVREKGYTLVWTEKHWNQRRLTRLLLIPSSNDLSAPAICGTNRNKGDDSREVVNWCARLRKSFSFQIAGAGFDSLELDFDKPLAPGMALAQEIAAFCPEVEVPPSDEAGLAELAGELETSGRCFLWWD